MTKLKAQIRLGFPNSEGTGGKTAELQDREFLKKKHTVILKSLLAILLRPEKTYCDLKKVFSVNKSSNFGLYKQYKFSARYLLPFFNKLHICKYILAIN